MGEFSSSKPSGMHQGTSKPPRVQGHVPRGKMLVAASYHLLNQDQGKHDAQERDQRDGRQRRDGVRRVSGRKQRAPDNSMTSHKSCQPSGRWWEKVLELPVQVLHPQKREELPGMGCWAVKGPAEAAPPCLSACPATGC